ncbi:hypothetical protein GCM10011344_09640 [Dokdonia pacifica]|uniref:Uncharacterized protein n=1 Tax=Dokdonia pacifica TaxID=1627892 RepID=A0A238YPX6_9FLAO|nr:hypothetical protein [Dokdonia pacifica]GGG11007.1 hypothetical protein GCM10011344_09640 [Dokdonia pacifica]SNR72751.1 hypothetical protein SAMN06265376_102232 [Dokdonia pacifica]
MKTIQSVLFFLLFFIIHNSFGQIDETSYPSNDKVVLPNDLHELEIERLELISNMYGMMYEISSLFTELERSESLEKLVKNYEELKKTHRDTSMFATDHELQLKRLQDIKTQIILPALSSDIDVSSLDLESMSVSEGFRRIIENKVQHVLKKTDELSSVGAKVTELNNTSYVGQNFKKQISWSFAFLVGIVIVGFFIIANRDDQIRKSIFTGDAGLQFITIFSIIIAIILFGITEILGGKEISALLGGISGYILGRSSLSKPFKTREVKKE